MASFSGLRLLARAAPRLGAASHLRCFAAASGAGGQRPPVPPAGRKPPPGPPVQPRANVQAATAKPPAPATKPAAPPAVGAAAAAAPKRRARGTRDPERPKQPASPWVRYLVFFRKQNATLKGPEVMRVAASKWKALNVEQRKPYQAPYEVEKKVYGKAFAEYVASGKRDAWKRDPAKPKRPMTGFLRFAGEYRKKHTSLKMTEATKKAGAVWKSMTAGAKAPYEKQYATEKMQYDKLMEVYKVSGKEAAWKAKKGLTAAEKRKARETVQKAKEAAKKLRMKAAAAMQKQRQATKKLKIRAVAAKLKTKQAAKNLKMKEVAARMKTREAAKKLKMQAAAAKQKAADKKLKMKESAAKAKAKEASKKAKHAAVKLTQMQRAKKTASESRASA